MIKSQYCGPRNGPAVDDIIHIVAIAMNAMAISRLTLSKLVSSLIF
jgi:hypothetical protein